MPKTYIEKIDNKDGGVINIDSSTQKSSFGHALYYPHIHLTNKNWLKHAFLFWDQISRIVPSSFQPQDNEDIIRIRQETSFLEDYHPPHSVISKTFRNFVQELDNYFYNHELRDDYYITRTSSIKYEKLFHKTQYKTMQEGSYIHVDKIDPKLVHMLYEFGLAVPGEYEWSSWIKIDNKIGALYMTYLAKSISNEKSIPIVTDRAEFLTSSIFEEIGYKHKFKEQLGYLIIDSVVPKNINNVTMEQLIQIRKKYDDQRVVFFDEINKLSSVLPSMDNKSQLKDALNYHNKLLKKQTKELKKVFELNGIESVVKPIAMSMGVSMATEYMIPTEHKWLGVSAGLVYGAATTYTHIKKRQIETEKDPMSYLLNIQSELDKKSLFQKIQAMSRF